MPNNSLYKFFVSIVLPAILAILLFIISFFVVIIPQFEKNLMDARKQTIKELTQSAWSVLKEHQENYKDTLFTRSEAQKKAASQIGKMRYGPSRKDYFWIIDQQPRMIMHPYRTELEGHDLSDYEDSHGKKLFVRAVEIVRKNDDGFIDYYWQWKDDTSRVVPKLSYVKGFEPWGWVIGTGIYLEDVRAEITHLKNRLLIISAGIILLIIITWIYVIRQSLKLEFKRRAAEQNLRLSRQKYKSLVEASNDGTLMLVNDKVIYHNFKMDRLLDKEFTDSSFPGFDDLFAIKWNDVKDTMQQPGKSYNIETYLLMPGKAPKDVVLSISKVDYAREEGFIVIVKDISPDKQINRESKELARELQLPLLLMTQPITYSVRPHLTIPINSTVQQAASQMKRYGQKVVFVTSEYNIVGVVTQNDLQNRLVAEQKPFESPVSSIMTAPVADTPSSTPLFEVVIKCWQQKISYLLVRDNAGVAVGFVSKNQLLDFQQNTLGFLIKEIYTAETIDKLAQLHKRIPVVINALLETGSKSSNITYLNSVVADTIHERVIELAIEEMGEPPVSFSFMVLGSEGRMEETLYTDQDNAIIFEDSEYGDAAKSYFQHFARKVNDNLHQIGYNRCPGEIMASNPKWCQSLSTWKKYFSDWTQSPEPQNILDSSIFFDFRSVYGNQQMIESLHEHLQSLTPQNGLFFRHMTSSINRFKPFIEAETIDLKKIIFPLVSGIRIYSLYYGFSSTNTLARLHAIADKLKNNLEEEELSYIYNFLMHKRLQIQTNALMNHEPPDNMLDINTLTHAEHTLLDHSIHKINEFLSGLNMDFVR